MSYKAQVESVKSMRELAIELGLTSEEYDRIIELIGREPTFEELGMFSVMWSEH
ncbi:hypothetical protein JGI9_01729, partial [Candidatus Kryptonium thompsonii]